MGSICAMTSATGSRRGAPPRAARRAIQAARLRSGRDLPATREDKPGSVRGIIRRLRAGEAITRGWQLGPLPSLTVAARLPRSRTSAHGSSRSSRSCARTRNRSEPFSWPEGSSQLHERDLICAGGASSQRPRARLPDRPSRRSRRAGSPRRPPPPARCDLGRDRVRHSSSCPTPPHREASVGPY